MTAAALYDALLQDGFTLRVDGQRLIVSPFSKLTAGQKESLSRHKTDVIMLVRNSGPLTPLDQEMAAVAWDDLIPSREYREGWLRLAGMEAATLPGLRERWAKLCRRKGWAGERRAGVADEGGRQPDLFDDLS